VAGLYELRLRLGHLDPARIAAEPDTVRAAVARPPALHRYVNHAPEWLVRAAARVGSAPLADQRLDGCLTAAGMRKPRLHP
jgi:hypothetical protein